MWTLDAGHWTLDIGYWILDSEHPRHRPRDDASSDRRLFVSLTVMRWSWAQTKQTRLFSAVLLQLLCLVQRDRHTAAHAGSILADSSRRPPSDAQHASLHAGRCFCALRPAVIPGQGDLFFHCVCRFLSVHPLDRPLLSPYSWLPKRLSLPISLLFSSLSFSFCLSPCRIGASSQVPS